MFEEARVLTHSSIKISGRQTIYFDPYEIAEESHDADAIFVTHGHFDHFSPKDIQMVAKEDTFLFLPECMRDMADQAGVGKCVFLKQDGITEERDLAIKTIPAYNMRQPFHTKEQGYVGYIVTMDHVDYYVAGDTDMTPENQKIKCDVAFVPVGGKFTMDYKEAAELVNCMMPKLAVPTHYGAVAGSAEDGKKFAELVDKKIEVRVML